MRARRSGPRTPERADATGAVATVPAAIAGLVAGIVLAIVLVGVPMGAAMLDRYGPAGPAFLLIFPAFMLSLTLVGGFVAIRVPGNPIGWLLELSGLCAAIAIFGGNYVTFAHEMAGDALPLVPLVAWLSSWTMPPAIGILFIYLPLLFPTGQFLSRRWRSFGLLGLVAASASVAASAFAPGPLPNTPWLANPFGFPAAADALSSVGAVSNAVSVVYFGAAIISLVLRFRRAGRLERQQLKWFGLVAGVAIVAFVLALLNLGPVSDAAWVFGLVMLVALPAAIGIAILRYRLWDIDRIVSRTVGYAIVTGVLGATFAGLVLALDAALAPLASGNSLAVASSTLIVFALFQPLRRRIQVAVDRRFDRSRYDGQRLLDAFGERMRDEVDLGAIHDRILADVDAAVRPTSAGLWLRSGPAGDAS